jgi:hypothetical protein
MLWTICFMLLLMGDVRNGVRLHFWWARALLVGVGIWACSNSVDQWPPSSHLRHFFALMAAAHPFALRAIAVSLGAGLRFRSSKSDGILQPLCGSSELSRIICLVPVLR